MTAPAELDLKTLEVTDAQLAKLLDVSARRVRQLAEQGTLERVAPGRFCLGDAVQALIDQAGGAGSEFQKQRTRKITADADRAELELAIARKDVAPVKDMEDAMDQFVGLVRTNMLHIPVRVTSMLLGETDERRFKDVLRKEIVQILTDAAEDDLNINEFEENDENA